MSPEIIGVLAGALLGIVSLFILRTVADSIESKNTGVSPKQAEQRKVADLIRSIAWLDIVIFAVVGYFVGPMFF